MIDRKYRHCPLLRLPDRQCLLFFYPIASGNGPVPKSTQKSEWDSPRSDRPGNVSPDRRRQPTLAVHASEHVLRHEKCRRGLMDGNQEYRLGRQVLRQNRPNEPGSDGRVKA